MAILGKSICGTLSHNQGLSRCTTELGQLNYLIAIPKDYVISEAELQNLDNVLREKALADNVNDRWYLIGPFVNFESTNTEAPQETFNDNSSVYTGLGEWSWTMRMIAGGLCGYHNLLKIHQTQDKFDFLHVHKSILLGGVKAKDDLNRPGMKGVRYSQMFTPNFVGGNGTANPTYQLMGKVGESEQMREPYTFVNLRDMLIDIRSVMQPLIDVQLDAETVGGNYAVQDVEATTVCGGVDLSGIYGTELEDPAAWKALNELGQEIAITSVVLNGVFFRVTVNSADPNYTANGKYFLQWQELSELATLGITGYDAIPTQVDTNPSS